MMTIKSNGSFEAGTRALNARDLATLNRVGDPQLSPDSRFLAFVVQSADWEGNRAVNSLRILDMEAPEARPRHLEIADKPCWHPRWSEDGTHLYYLCDRSGSPQVWRTDIQGVVGFQVTRLPFAVESFRLVPADRGIVVTATSPGCSSRATVDTDEGKASSMIFDSLPVRNWNYWVTDAATQLVSLRLDENGGVQGEPVFLLQGFAGRMPDRPACNDTDYAVTASHAIFSALPPGEVWGVGNGYRLYHVPLDGSTPPVEFRAEDEGVRNIKPTLSWGGTRLAFLRKAAGSEEMRSEAIIVDLSTNKETEACPDFALSPGVPAWGEGDGTVFFPTADRGRMRLFAVNLESGARRALTDDGEVLHLTTAKGRLVVALSSLGRPGDLYELADGMVRRLTAINCDRLDGIVLSPYEQFSFAGWNDDTVYGYIVWPHGYQAGQKFPVALVVHGGPYASLGDSWHYRWNAQLLAGMGFAVVMIDFHGSAGYGEEFGKAIVNHWGDRPLEDLQKGWAAALAKYEFLDAERACALGGSYGGYMIAWMAGVWNAPWKCLVIHNGIVDVRSWALTGDVPGFAEYEFGGFCWENAEGYQRFNPLDKAGNWCKPTMIIVGGNDFRVPLSQGQIAFTVAQRKGIASRLVHYPDENHFVLKPRNVVDWYRQVEDWLNRWL